ncbi:DUF1559 family PulG-like putative transporter [Frigoriglobus tundricola]|uniref:DUF1559 domain-containing protein n=1 Tax=Frigoriglobus tundricola TaxID=2774151 RepID=A0A6M5YR31_9BACT|nr:DUF1559 domain-containing protein [Frigoriglobus tundricola]QJW96527.1 hypothetical protein FTUN_4084 [Frigoriglobus tundricola]
MPRRYVLVLVAVTLVVLGAGLLFTAVSRVREAAARMACTSHFKQWALALHNYAALFPDERGTKKLDAFPAGTVPNSVLPPEERLSWWVPVLPFMEQGAVCDQFDLTRGAGDPRNAEPVSHRLQWLVCPSSGEYDRGTHEWKSAAPLTHYVGVAGVGPDAATLPLGHPRAGVFGYDRRTAFLGDFPDGVSNTLLLIETAQTPGHWAYGGAATVRAFAPDMAPYIGPGRPFGGWHNGTPVLFGQRTHTCVVAMADGAVRSFSNATAPEVLEALATVAGHESLPADW